jgi:hypothetical protein
MKRFVLLGFVLAACGPNYRYAYEGEGAFERCYALDYDNGAAPETRQQCWSAWLQSYSFGAGVDRVEYARGRVAQQPGANPTAVMPGPVAPTLSARNDATSMNPMAPPPATAPASANAADAWQRTQVSAGGTAIGAPSPTAPPAAPEAEPPGASCATGCHDTWHTCGTACAAGAATCVARCDDGYRDCMRGCF